MEEKPKLRPLEAFPIDYQGERSICLRDPQRITDQNLFINDFAFFIITQFDGTKTVRDVQADFTRRTSELLPESQIVNLLETLDEYFFLENERYHNKLEQLRSEYANLSVRPSSHAGISYPADPAELKQLLDSFYDADKNDNRANETGVHSFNKNIKGILAPHIDIRHGGPCFASAYSALKDRKPELFVILGVAHAMSQNFFTAVTRDFHTPLGDVCVDRHGLDILADRLGDSISAEEFEHRNEHSIEFQTVFLRHLYGDETPPVLPVLCSSFHPMIESGEEPSAVPEVKEFLDALAAAVDGRDACWIGGVDLAHVGRRFGDSFSPDESTRETIMRQDIEMLKTVERADAAAFFKSVASTGDSRRICGFPAIYAFLCLSGAQRGRIIKYEQMLDSNSGSVVSFTSMEFE